MWSFNWKYFNCYTTSMVKRVCHSIQELWAFLSQSKSIYRQSSQLDEDETETTTEVDILQVSEAYHTLSLNSNLAIERILHRKRRFYNRQFRMLLFSNLECFISGKFKINLPICIKLIKSKNSFIQLCHQPYNYNRVAMLPRVYLIRFPWPNITIVCFGKTHFPNKYFQLLAV